MDELFVRNRITELRTKKSVAYDDYYHSGHVSYQGSTSKQYKAYICFWAGKEGLGDTRYMWAYEA